MTKIERNFLISLFVLAIIIFVLVFWLISEPKTEILPREMATPEQITQEQLEELETLRREQKFLSPKEIQKQLEELKRLRGY